MQAKVGSAPDCLLCSHGFTMRFGKLTDILEAWALGLLQTSGVTRGLARLRARLERTKQLYGVFGTLMVIRRPLPRRARDLEVY